jgi:hypothetical protein
MRTKLLVLGSTLAILAALSPVPASAKRITAAGSLAITLGTGAPILNGELVVTTVMSNPGLEKTVTQQAPLPGPIPIYVLPFFVDQEKGNSGPGNLDTKVLLTNTTGQPLAIKITIRGPDGDQLPGSPHDLTLSPHATQVISLSDVIE